MEDPDGVQMTGPPTEDLVVEVTEVVPIVLAEGV